MSRTARWQPPSKRLYLPRPLNTIAAICVKLRLLWLILVAFFLLSGCVRSDIDIHFQDANHGKIIQHIRIAQGTTGVENAIASIWLDNLEQQTQALGGSVRQVANQDVQLNVPFFNAKDLEAKFNQLFQAEWQSSAAPQLPTIASRLKMRSGNWVLWQRMVLDYELDLRSLTPLTEESFSLDPSKLLQLEFSLSTTGSTRSLETENLPSLRNQGHKLVWQLHPGEHNHLHAVFWVPSPLGIGAVLIALFVAVGAIVKAQPLIEPTEG